jgi:hypothetical protein
MEGWDLAKVKELAEQYNAAGMGDTSAGRFLSSLATEGKPPRGNGVRWMNDLLLKGDPGRFTGLLDEVLRLASECPTLVLRSLEKTLRRGEPLASWQQKLLEDARILSQEPHIELTPDERHLVSELNTVRLSRSSFYWQGRPGIHARLLLIFTRVDIGAPIRRSDLDFVFEQFGPAVRELRDPKFKIGDLVGLPDSRIGMVVSTPIADAVIRYEVLVDGNKVDLPIGSLRKRIKR